MPGASRLGPVALRAGPLARSAGGPDALIAKSLAWRGVALANLRRVIHTADPGMAEEVKWKRPGNPLGARVFEHNGIVCIGVIS